MSAWRKRFTRKSQRISENNEIFLNNTIKYRKKLQAAIYQINRTKKCTQRNIDNPDSDIHVARLINDIGQLSDCKSLQEISSLIDSLAMRHQLSSRIFNEYAMNSLQQSLEKLNNNLSNDFDKVKSVFEEAVTNHCSDHTKNQLFNKVEFEWFKHKKLAITELKYGLSSYCDIGLYNLRIQIAILEKLQNFIDQLSSDENDANTGLPNFNTNSSQTRKEIDTMLRIMLDRAPNDPNSLPNSKRPKFLNNQFVLSNSLYSSEITEAAARSHGQSLREQNACFIPQYPSMIPSATTASAQMPQHESMMITPHNDRFQNTPDNDDDNLPSYSDLFVVPSSCKQERIQRRSSRFNNQ
ncbi:unnamed protein product [Rotaria sp. Silwood1]|nr:unnamed protein product [Rotaria sp. Silwood1]CAF4687057.1 unnamed protein product [Rotaria sp. Silwood1]CAF4705714.1 unnamed protein product [Rotaria sp. Silwood1]CAF4741972.1 unnamed protein product [Rotaria sp. Silwood1]